MLQSLIQLKPRDVPLRVALRNAFAVVAPLAIGVATGHAGIGLGIAAGALNTMFLDQPGPYRLRMQRMLLTAIAAGLSAFAGGVLGANAVLLTIAALVWGVAGGLLVALGPNAGRAGLTSMTRIPSDEIPQRFDRGKTLSRFDSQPSPEPAACESPRTGREFWGRAMTRALCARCVLHTAR